MSSLRPLMGSDVVQIHGWPAYTGDMAQMDYALREKGWLDECRGKPGVFVYAVEDGDELIGFTLLQETGKGEAEFRIALRADQTGLGRGEEITLKTLHLGFTSRLFSRIHLIVRKNNQRGIRLYRRIGFVERGKCRKAVQGMMVDFLVMDITPGELRERGSKRGTL